MTKISHRALLAVLLNLFSSLLLSRAALANNRFVESLEWAAIDAQCIVRAKVTGVDEEARIPPNDIIWCKVELKVLETIKGPATDRLTVAEWECEGESRPGVSDQEVLIFLDRRERYGDGDNMPGHSEWVVRRHGGWYRTHSESQFIRINGDWMRTIWREKNEVVHDEMLSRVRQTVKWAAGRAAVRPWIVGVQISDGWDVLGYQLVVPLGEPFFRQARDYLSRNPDVAGRRAALEYLAQSNTPENQTAIRQLFHDQEYLFPDPRPLSTWHYRRFPIREEAYYALRKWDDPVDRPVINDPADWHEPTGRTLVGLAVIVMAWPVGWLFASRKNEARFSFGGMVGMLGFMITIALGIVWATSISQAWSLAWQRNEMRWQLVSFDGVIRLARFKEDDDGIISRPVGVVGAILQPDASNIHTWDLRAVDLQNGAWSRFGINIGDGAKPLSGGASPLWVAIVPWSWVFLVAILATLIFAGPCVRQWDRRRTRGRRGLCVGCGYDLRASPGRCPECGKVVGEVFGK